MRLAIAVVTGINWNMDRGMGRRRWVFPAPAPRSRRGNNLGNSAHVDL
jgi:hypothetical protein